MKLVCYDPHARRTDIADAMKAFPEIDFARPTTLDELAADLAGAQVLVTSNRAYEAECARVVRDNGQSLRWIQFTTSGFDKAAGAGLPSGCVVTNAAGLRAFSVAEHALFLMLALARQSRMAEQGQVGGAWVRDSITPRMDNLAGKHLLVIGLGAIGQEIARKAKAFDMRVTGVSRTSERPPHVDAVRPRAELRESIAAADVIVMAATYEAGAPPTMNAEMIAAMKPSALFVNIARGALLDQAALVDALRSGRIAGAGLDVTDVEPLPSGHPLYALSNVVLTPHIAGAGSDGTGAGMGRILADNLRRFLKGERLQKIVIERTP